ncbi:hypothetical protein ACIBEK_08095 [Nocardia fusca]|uniref:hypothetical protein n=1 Tax=Nocardia fusca TaxID=941183 RepID=UPI003787E2E7
MIFQAGGGTNGLALAGRFADGVYAIEDSRAQRNALREPPNAPDATPTRSRCSPASCPPSPRRAALGRRRLLDESVDLRRRVRYLGAMIGLPLDYDHIDEPIPDSARAAARPSPFDPRSARALEVARQGWTLRDILAHAVIDYHPVVAGTATDVADHMQRWFEAGACDGFSVAIDGYHDGVDAFVDQVVPILQERGLFHHDYEGPTLRDHLGARAQYGLDQRLTAPEPAHTRSS